MSDRVSIVPRSLTITDRALREKATTMTSTHGSNDATRPEPSTRKRTKVVPSLNPLTPKYEPKRHRVYVDAIEKALAWRGSDAVRNLALTGSYGVGKSSILKQVAETHSSSVVQISLSTLGFDDSDHPDARGEDTKTNRIQKEIVKQLLYTQDPTSMPGSRYRRTTGFRFKRELGIASLAALPVALLFFLVGWTKRIAVLFVVPDDWALAANAGLYVVAVVFVLLLRWALHNKIRIDSITAGAATIKLSEDSATYFDEYLDEIVYFFEVTRCNLVIFEDIDRFEDAHIFETLRSLNTLLNGAKQLDGHPVCFIYAIKDSIFEDIGTRAAKQEAADDGRADSDNDAAVLEVARANRTKFFDLVIPVVPFITHQTAREQLEAELEGPDHQISSDLIDLAAQHVADMRLIKNIRNEFVIFRDRVISSSTLELNDDALFAMVLYKSTHLSDFELIKLGRSRLDWLYGASREIVRQNTARLNREIVEAQRKLNSNAVGDDRARAFGDKLDAAIERTFRLGSLHRGGQSYRGATVSSTELRMPKFWHDYAASGGDIAVTYRNPYQSYMSSSTLSEADIADILGEPVAHAAWDAASREHLENEIKDLRVDIAFLARADMSDLMDRDDLVLTASNETRPFSTLVTNALNSRLARSLLAAGYINRYFTLYTATFVGERVSANAMNFILKVVDAGAIDTLFALTRDDVRAVVKERRSALFRERAAYNLDVVDYLVASDPSGATSVAMKLARGGESERTFLRTHLTSARDSAALLQLLAPRWNGLFSFLVSDAGLEGEALVSAVDAALGALDPERDYSGDRVGAFVVDHYTEMTIFTSDETPAGTADLLASLLRDSDLLLPRLAPLGADVRRAVVDAESFAVTRENLEVALGDDRSSISLDHLRTHSPHAYRRAISDLERYLAALEAGEQTIATAEAFAPVLEDAFAADRGVVAEIVSRSTPEAVLEDLSRVPTGIWPALAVNSRFPPSLANVLAYSSEFGIDESLAVVLGPGTIETDADVEDEAKAALLTKLLSSSAVLPSADIRARLIYELDLADWLDPTAVPVEKGEWIGRLIEHRVIPDHPSSFGLIVPDDWSGREFAISVSAEFGSFLSPTVLPASSIAPFLASTSLADSLKAVVVGRFDEFSAGVGRAGLEAMVTYANRRGIGLTLQNVAQLARGSGNKALVMATLQPLLRSATLETLEPILTALGGDYTLLATPSAKQPKLAITAENRALLARLKELDRVSSYPEKRGEYRVFLKHQ